MVFRPSSRPEVISLKLMQDLKKEEEEEEEEEEIIDAESVYYVLQTQQRTIRTLSTTKPSVPKVVWCASWKAVFTF
jgi:hypothetical protein